LDANPASCEIGAVVAKGDAESNGQASWAAREISVDPRREPAAARALDPGYYFASAQQHRRRFPFRRADNVRTHVHHVLYLKQIDVAAGPHELGATEGEP